MTRHAGNRVACGTMRAAARQSRAVFGPHGHCVRNTTHGRSMPAENGSRANASPARAMGEGARTPRAGVLVASRCVWTGMIGQVRPGVQRSRATRSPWDTMRESPPRLHAASRRHRDSVRPATRGRVSHATWRRRAPRQQAQPPGSVCDSRARRSEGMGAASGPPHVARGSHTTWRRTTARSPKRPYDMASKLHT